MGRRCSGRRRVRRGWSGRRRRGRWRRGRRRRRRRVGVASSSRPSRRATRGWVGRRSVVRAWAVVVDDDGEVGQGRGGFGRAGGGAGEEGAGGGGQVEGGAAGAGAVVGGGGSGEVVQGDAVCGEELLGERGGVAAVGAVPVQAGAFDERAAACGGCRGHIDQAPVGAFPRRLVRPSSSVQWISGAPGRSLLDAGHFRLVLCVTGHVNHDTVPPQSGEPDVPAPTDLPLR